MLKEFQNLDSEEILIINLRKLFENYGYEKLNVNVFEDYDVYHRNQDLIENENVLKLIHPSGKLYALRADMTISTAKKFASEDSANILAEKVYYYGTVFRNNTSLNGGLTQEKQIGIECLGVNDVISDAEALYLANETLSRIADEYALDISNVKFVKSIFSEAKLKRSIEEEILKLIYTTNTYDLEKLLNKIEDLDEKVKAAINAVPKLYGNFDKVISEAREFALNDEMSEILDYFETLLAVLKHYKIADKVKIDFSISNSLHYYTGIIFQGYVSGLYKPVLLGGRYDKLAQRFGGDLPAIGFSVTLDPVVKQMKTEKKKTDYLLIYKESDLSVFTKAEELRAEGNTVKVVPFKAIAEEEFDKLETKYENIIIIDKVELSEESDTKEEPCL
jgi:ATP phosphoribosyltransferase regulatory subunit